MSCANSDERADAGTAENEPEFLEFFERYDALMLEDPRAAVVWLDAAPASMRAESQWVLCKAEALYSADGAKVAADYLKEVLTEAPEFADAHHYLAGLEQDLGHTRQAIEHQLVTLRLDSVVDLVAEPVSDEMTEAVVAEAERTLAGLPDQFKRRLVHVPVLLQPRPNISLVADGFDARALGLFEGANLAEAECGNGEVGLTTITLFTQCLSDAFGHDEQELLEQVRVTVLHEVGHYFCLDEDALAELELS